MAFNNAITQAPLLLKFSSQFNRLDVEGYSACGNTEGSISKFAKKYCDGVIKVNAALVWRYVIVATQGSSNERHIELHYENCRIQGF